MFLSTNRGRGIFTVFSRTNFKGVCVGGRACVDDATVKVDERHSPSHCADVSRKDKTSRSSDYATGRTSFWPADTQPTDEVESERGGRSDRFSDHWLSCGSIGEKRPLNPVCHGPRPRNPCLNRDWRPGVTSPLVSHSLSQFFFSFFILKSTGAEKRSRLWTVSINSLLIIADSSKFTLAIYNDTKIRWLVGRSPLIKVSI